MTVQPGSNVTLLPGTAEEDSQTVLLESYRSSARLNGMRADGLQIENTHLRDQMALVQSSLSWRVTAPLRLVRGLSLGRLPSVSPLKNFLIALLSFGAKAAFGQ